MEAGSGFSDEMKKTQLWNVGLLNRQIARFDESSAI